MHLAEAIGWHFLLIAFFPELRFSRFQVTHAMTGRLLGGRTMVATLFSKRGLERLVCNPSVTSHACPLKHSQLNNREWLGFDWGTGCADVLAPKTVLRLESEGWGTLFAHPISLALLY